LPSRPKADDASLTLCWISLVRSESDESMLPR